MMIPRGNGAAVPRRKAERNSAAIAWYRKVPAIPAAELPRVGRKCTRSEACPAAIAGIAQYGGSDHPACDRTPPQLLIRDAAVPTTDPCPDSTGSDHRGPSVWVEPDP